MDFWGLMIKKDDMIISCVEGIRSIITLIPQHFDLTLFISS